MKLKFSNKTILMEKLRESLASVAPITLIVFIICFSIISVPSDLLLSFVIGAVMLVFGMGLFTLGTDISMTPAGLHIGSAVTKSKKLWFIIAVCLFVGTIITISEPDLQVLAEQVPNIPNMVIILTVSIGVGIFLVIAMLRILFKIRLSYILMFFYVILFAFAVFVPKSFLAVAFDAGGVTTGPMTVPFILALGSGVAAIRGDKDAENDSFGLVALCSVGPIIAVMALGMIFNPEKSGYTEAAIPDIETSQKLWGTFSSHIPEYMWEVTIALFPIIIFFYLFQIFSLKLQKETIIRISVGFLYTYVGLVLFLTGVNVGFMPVGRLIGEELGKLDYNLIIVPIGIVIGYFIVAAEPAVHVLNKQVYEMTSGAISRKALSTSLSYGVAASVGLAMLRIVCGIPIMYFLVPGYAIALILTFFCPPMFTAIAFDSGGVASGPMTATFLLSLAIGACVSCGGDVVTDAFGVVALVAMTPLIAIQILGIVYKLKVAKKEAQAKLDIINELSDTSIIELEDENE